MGHDFQPTTTTITLESKNKILTSWTLIIIRIIWQQDRNESNALIRWDQAEQPGHEKKHFLRTDRWACLPHGIPGGDFEMSDLCPAG